MLPEAAGADPAGHGGGGLVAARRARHSQRCRLPGCGPVRHVGPVWGAAGGACCREECGAAGAGHGPSCPQQFPRPVLPPRQASVPATRLVILLWFVVDPELVVARSVPPPCPPSPHSRTSKYTRYRPGDTPVF